jgi:hypothetical protein
MASAEGTQPTVAERDLYQALIRIRDMRKWVVENHIDPWATRQALIMALALDTHAALSRGVSQDALKEFDRLAIEDAAAWAQDRHPL